MHFLGLDWYFFDFDGTLVDTAGDILANMKRSYSAIERLKDAEPHAGLIGPSLQEMVKTLTPDISDAELKTFTEEYAKMYVLRDFKHTAYYPGAEELVLKLKGLGKKLGIVTNKPKRNLGFLFQKLGGFERFDLVCTPDMLEGKEIEKPRMFEILINSGVSPKKAVMIGDAPTDITSAKSHGLFTVGLSGGYGKAASVISAVPDIMVLNLKELFEKAEGTFLSKENRSGE